MLKQDIIDLLTQNKAEDIQHFQCSDYISEHTIVATALNGVHALSLAEKLISLAKTHEHTVLSDGNAKDGWIAVEINNTITHLMTQERRAYFNLEDFLKSLKKKTQ